MLENKKAEDIVIIDLRSQIHWTDTFIICTAPTDVHRRVIAETVLEETHEAGFDPVGRGLMEAGASWILLDYGGTLVHIFSPDGRRTYNLERTWGEADNVVVVE